MKAVNIGCAPFIFSCWRLCQYRFNEQLGRGFFLSTLQHIYCGHTERYWLLRHRRRLGMVIWGFSFETISFCSTPYIFNRLYHIFLTLSIFINLIFSIYRSHKHFSDQKDMTIVKHYLAYLPTVAPLHKVYTTQIQTYVIPPLIHGRDTPSDQKIKKVKWNHGHLRTF